MNVSFKIGTRAQFNQITQFRKGAWYLCKDTGELFYGGGDEKSDEGYVSSSEMILVNSATTYASCSTAAGTAAKSITGIKGFILTAGVRVLVKFSNTNTANNPTLNINGTGAKAIKFNGANVSRYSLIAGQIYEFVYDGTNYILIGGTNATIEVPLNNAETSYTVTHNLNCYPSVLVLDADGYLVEPLIQYPNANSVTVYWNGTFTGKIVVQR